MGQNVWSYFDGSVVRNHMIRVEECHISVNPNLLALKRRLNRQIARTESCYDGFIYSVISLLFYPKSAGYLSNTKQ